MPIPTLRSPRFLQRTLALAAVTGGLACAGADPVSPPPENPLLVESALPFGFPRFDLIRDEHFAPAFDFAIAENEREVDAITANPEPATFENTIVALERCGTRLDRIQRIFSGLEGADTNPVRQALDEALAPRLAALGDRMLLDPALFARVDAVFARRAQLGLDPESLRLVEKTHEDFVRAGAALPAAQKERLKAINAELASLETRFGQNVIKEVNASAVLVTDPARLAGLTAAEISAAATAAEQAGHPGQHLLRLRNTTGQPLLASLSDRGLRQEILETSMARGGRGGEFDNRDNVLRLVRLRTERASILGYPTHAAFMLERQTAGTPEAVNGLLGRLAPAAVANARAEAADLQRLLARDHPGATLAAADWDYYAEMLRRERHDFDENRLRPYLELEHVLRDGVFFAATRLYGLTFHERPDLPVYEPSVRVFEVREADGATLAYFIVDWYARPSKRGGAWMSAYVPQSTLLGTRPVIANHLNVAAPAAGEPTLLTFDEVVTAFHEFGHALHGMFSAVRYPRFAGTAVPRDFVEFPSQVNEMWATWPEVLRNYAKHFQTGEPMPEELLAKLEATKRFNQGYKTTEYLAAALLDQAWHQLAPDRFPGDVAAFEQEALARAGVDFAPVPPRYRSTYFSHVFNNNYHAGYYSYLWAEVLDADSVEWFKENGGLTRANGDRLRAHVLSRGGSAPAMDLYRAFAGRDPDIAPLLERRGLAGGGATAAAQ